MTAAHGAAPPPPDLVRAHARALALLDETSAAMAQILDLADRLAPDPEGPPDHDR